MALLPTLAALASVVPRRAVLAGGLAGMVPAAAIADNKGGSFLAPPERIGLQAKWLEQIRIVLQDEADNVKYGGELAPGGLPSQSGSGLRLLPIVQMQATLRKIAPLLSDQSKWSALREIVSSGPFVPLEFKRIFNLYSDNIYYSADTAEANVYLLGGATPSTSQTTQYLLRNEALKQVAELGDELKYQIGLPVEKRETEVADEALAAALKAFDEYLALAPADDLKFAREAVYGEGKR